MLNFPSFFDQGVHSTLRLKPGANWSYKGQWVQIFNDTEIDRWYVGDFSSASYQITVEYNSNKKEILNALVVARPDEASVVIYGRVSIDDELITLTVTVNDSYLSLKASPTTSTFEGAKLIFLATYAQTINALTVPESLNYVLPQEETPGSGSGTGGSGGGSGGGGGSSGALYIDDLLDVTILSPVPDQYLKFNGTSWVNSALSLPNYAPIDNPAFTGTVTGVTAGMVGLGNVTNESKTTMFASPTFTGTVTGITAAMVGLGNVTNESKATMFANPTFTGFTDINQADIAGLAIGGSIPVTLISSDSTLSAASPTTLSTESAVKAYVDATVSGITLNPNNLNLTGHTTIEGVTTTGATGTGNLVFASSPTINNLTATGLTSFGLVSEIVSNLSSATGTVTHDCSSTSVFYHTSITANFTANFTNVPTTADKVLTVTLILNQGATGYYSNAVQINGAAQTLRWSNNTTPTVSTNKVDLVSFNLIRTASSWIVTGTYINYA
jgi:hypothetical protein